MCVIFKTSHNPPLTYALAFRRSAGGKQIFSVAELRAGQESLSFRGPCVGRGVGARLKLAWVYALAVGRERRDSVQVGPPRLGWRDSD